MSEYIEVGQPLQFTDPNTPTRVGEIVENVSDIYNIPSPRLGMQVFVKSEKKSFVITSLKNKVIGGVDVPEAAVEAFEAVGAKSITWNNDTNQSNMNDFVVAGVYDIKGERTRINDNLPILNTGGGHSFNARLTVLDSSISGNGKDDDKCITQVLSFSNRLGQGEVYIRTGKGSSLDNLTWEKWSSLQRNVNVEEVSSLDDLKDNGIYSGVWLFGSLNNYPLTFVCVVINDYFIGTAPRRISQFVYGLSKFDGSVVYQSRVWDDSKDKWIDWEILNQKEISSMIKSSVDDAIKGIIADAPEAFDTLREIADWIANDETGAVALANAISTNTAAITAERTRAIGQEGLLNNAIAGEKTRAEQVEETIKNTAVEADSLKFLTRSNEVALNYKTIESVGGEITIPTATISTAGVMSAKDKVALDSIPNEIEKIKDGSTIAGQAREIHSRNGKSVTDSFLARTTAGSGTIGDGVATLKSVGGNIVKNLVDGTLENEWSKLNSLEQVKYQNNIVIVETNKTFQGVFRRIDCILNHKYYISADFFTDKRAYIMIDKASPNGSPYVSGSTWVHASNIVTAAETTNTFVALRSPDADAIFAATKPIVIDLTEMFGAGNEPTKEVCDKLLGTMDALPQGLTIANPTEFKSTGYNQADPDKVLANKGIENGSIVDKVGSNLAVVPCLPCKIGVGENNGYCVHGAFEEGAEMVYLTPLNPLEVEGELYLCELAKNADKGTYVPQINGYMLVEVPNATDLCVHFLWSEDKGRHDFEPYYESKVELPSTPEMSEWGLAGIKANGVLVQDKIDFERGVYIKRIGCVDMGTLSWTKHNEYNTYRASVVGMAAADTYEKRLHGVFASKYTVDTVISVDANFTNMTIKRFSASIALRDNSVSDKNALKESLQGVMLYYELAEPIEYPLQKVTNNYTSSDYGVEQFDSKVPCNANNLYYMRSLAGETRNFLDKLYKETGSVDANGAVDSLMNREVLLDRKVSPGIAFWGSSSTESDWVKNVAANLDMPYYWGGSGGENIWAIIGRMGVLPLRIEQPITIPASANEAVELPNNYQFKVKWNNAYKTATIWSSKTVQDYKLLVNPCYIAGIKGNLIGGGANSDIPLQFQRLEDGEAVTTKPYEPIYTFGFRETRDCVWFLACHFNGGQSSTEELVELYKKMYDASESKKVLILGGHKVANGAVTSPTLEMLQEQESALEDEFGLMFFNTREFMCGRGFERFKKIYPDNYTSADVEQAAQGITPDCMYVAAGNVHFNERAYNILTQEVVTVMKQLGYNLFRLGGDMEHPIY